MDGNAPITGLLLAWRAGEPDAPDRLFPLVYDELPGLARRLLAREHPGHALDTIALVGDRAASARPHGRARGRVRLRPMWRELGVRRRQ